MANRSRPLVAKVWGDLACFTRPEQKVERVSYPLMTPTAARGLLESIYWRPGLRWQVLRIHVLRPIRYQTLVRNEVDSRQSVTVAVAGLRRPQHSYDVTIDRTQRQTVALSNVAYLIEADLQAPGGTQGEAAAARERFQRRLQRGQCFQGPYLGCREFRADFAADDGSEHAIDLTCQLGPMLHEMIWQPGGHSVAHFFDAQLREGVLTVPSPAQH